MTDPESPTYPYEIQCITRTKDLFKTLEYTSDNDEKDEICKEYETNRTNEMKSRIDDLSTCKIRLMRSKWRFDEIRDNDMKFKRDGRPISNFLEQILEKEKLEYVEVIKNEINNGKDNTQEKKVSNNCNNTNEDITIVNNERTNNASTETNNNNNNNKNINEENENRRIDDNVNKENKENTKHINNTNENIDDESYYNNNEEEEEQRHNNSTYNTYNNANNNRIEINGRNNNFRSNYNNANNYRFDRNRDNNHHHKHNKQYNNKHSMRQNESTYNAHNPHHYYDEINNNNNRSYDNTIYDRREENKKSVYIHGKTYHLIKENNQNARQFNFNIEGTVEHFANRNTRQHPTTEWADYVTIEKLKRNSYKQERNYGSKTFKATFVTIQDRDLFLKWCEYWRNHGAFNGIQIDEWKSKEELRRDNNRSGTSYRNGAINSGQRERRRNPRL